MVAYFDTGYMVRQPAWHGLGEVLDDYPTSAAEARRLAGLEWEPLVEPVFRRRTAAMVGDEPLYEYVEPVNADTNDEGKPKPMFKFIVRSDNGKVLDCANNTYEVVPNGTMFSLVEAILEAGDAMGKPVRYETAGSLMGGRKVWALACLDEWELPGDPSQHKQYLALVSSHDGSAALKALGTDVRIVCANTEHAADIDARESGTAYTFRHTKNIAQRVSEARDAISGVYAQLDKVRERAIHLLDQRITVAQREAFIREFAIERTVSNMDIPRSPEKLAAAMETPRIQNAVASTMHVLGQLLDGRTSEGISGTAYGLVQAAGEFLDHARPYVSKETYFTRTVILPEPHKRLAHRVADRVLATV